MEGAELLVQTRPAELAFKLPRRYRLRVLSTREAELRADIKKLATLLRRAFTVDVKSAALEQALLTDQGFMETFIVEDRDLGHVVGTISTYRNPVGELFLHWLAVRDQYRHEGIGRALVRAGLAWCAIMAPGEPVYFQLDPELAKGAAGFWDRMVEDGLVDRAPGLTTAPATVRDPQAPPSEPPAHRSSSPR